MQKDVAVVRRCPVSYRPATVFKMMGAVLCHTHASSRLTSSWLPAGYAVQKIVEYIMYGGLSGKRDDRKAVKKF